MAEVAVVFDPLFHFDRLHLFQVFEVDQDAALVEDHELIDARLLHFNSYRLAGLRSLG